MCLTQDAGMRFEDDFAVASGNGIPVVDEQIQNDKFQVAFAHAGLGFTLTTPSGKLIEANSAYCALTGYTIEELRGHSFEQTIHPDDLELNMVQVQRLFAGDINSFTTQSRYIHKSGKMIWVQKSVSLGKCEANKPAWVITLVEDITERREAETVGRLKDERLSMLHRIIFEPSLTGTERLSQMLRLGIEEFGLENGVIADITDGLSHVVVTDTPDGSMTVGFNCDVRDAICTETLRGNDLLTIENSEQTDWRNHVANNEFGPEIYFCAPLAVEGEISGRLCYTNRVFRSEGFTTEAYKFLRLLAQTMSLEMTRQKNERALQESEERFRAAVGAVSDIIWTNNAEGEMKGDQPTWGAFTGQRQQDYQGYGWSKAVHPEDSQATIEAWNLAVAEKRTFEFEHRVRRHDGQWRTCSIRAVPVLDSTGEIREWVGVHTDITVQKRYEESLLRASDTFKSLVVNSPFGIFAVDADFRLMQVSAGAQKVFETVRPLIGRDLVEALRCIWSEPFASEAIGIFRHTLKTGKPYYGPSTVERRKDSEAIESYDWKIERLALPDGRYGVVCHFYDLSEWKRHEQQINDLNARLSRAMAESHHRIKNHLQMLSALVEMQPGEGEMVSRTALTRMSQHIQSLASLHDVLTSTSKVQGDSDMISVRETLDKMHPLLQASAGQRRMEFKVEEIQISLKQAGPFMLLVNELISNAIKHGSGDIELHFGVCDNLLRLEVCDDGPGFASDFDPKKAANMGLELIESLGRWDLKGEMTYENREGGGARVGLAFPVAKVH